MFLVRRKGTRLNRKIVRNGMGGRFKYVSSYRDAIRVGGNVGG